MPPNQNVRQMPRERIIEDFFVYTTGTIALAAAVSATGLANIVIQADSDFIFEKLTYFANVGADLTESTQVVPVATFLLTDTGSGRQLFNVPVSIAALCGRGQLPYILSKPKRFDANSVIQVQLINGVATAQNIEIVLSGRKVFTLSG